MTKFFPKHSKKSRPNKLENVTLRGFGGGWNTVDSDLTMDPKFLVTLHNFKRTPSGSQKLRFGSSWFSDISGLVDGDILDHTYFSASLIQVTVSGEIVAVDSEGDATVIWNSAIASLLPGAPSGWSDNLTTVDFVPFKNELIVHNGVDKPITISRALHVTYLQDLATGSNVNVPIGKYGCIVSNYHCVGGIPASPTTVFISSVGTSGTFPGDPAPNDSISIDIGAYAPQGAIEIRGIAGFRSNLLIFFQDQTVVAKLGIYSSDATPIHQPVFPDTMPTFGILGHRCKLPVDNDLLFAGIQGMTSTKRNILSVAGTLESNTLSEYIEPTYISNVGALTDTQQLKSCFMTYDSLAHETLLFIPGGNVFVYSWNEKLRYRSWSGYVGLNVTCACRSFLGRVFYAVGKKTYQHGNAAFIDEDYSFDRVNDRDGNWSAGTFYAAGYIARDTQTDESFRCTVNHTAVGPTFVEDRAQLPRWEAYKGEPLDFVLELPWLDSKDPMRVKFLKFVSVSTKGNVKFTLKAYVDNLYKDDNGAVRWGPAVMMDFIGNDAVGYGYDAGPYGGGRRSTDPRLFSFAAKFKIIKFIIEGSSGGDLEVANLSFLFLRGKYKR